MSTPEGINTDLIRLYHTGNHDDKYKVRYAIPGLKDRIMSCGDGDDFRIVIEDEDGDSGIAESQPCIEDLRLVQHSIEAVYWSEIKPEDSPRPGDA